MNKVFVIGSGGHSRSVISLLLQNKIKVSGIFDFLYRGPEEILGVPVLGDLKSIPAEGKIVLAVGDNSKRKALYESYKERQFNLNLFHPSSYYEPSCVLGANNIIFAKTYINACAQIGENNIINTASIIEHEVKIGSHNHIAVNATLLGRVSVGNECFIGSATVVKDGVSICNNVIIGANSFVASDITSPGTYVGSPARRIK